MNNLVKLLVVAGLALGIFGGGGYLAYRLFFKGLNGRWGNAGQAVVTPTPDPGITMLDQAKQQLASGNRAETVRILVALIQSFPDSIKSNDARQLLGDLDIRAFFSPEPGPDKTEYIVAHGDSIAKIANKTKAPAELIFKANGLESLIIQPGQRLIIPKGQFTLLINRKRQDVTLLNNGNFFRWYKPLEVKLPPKMAPGQFKTREKIAWSGGARVAFGEKNYLGSSRWIVVNENGVTLYSETNPQKPNTEKPDTGIMLGPSDMEELYALVTKETPVIVQ
ncbi:MAG TPA: LysM peptidoglycan-binding domain-containing protein [Chthoniobacterales bacterium]|jgi:LysM repeat protein